MRLLSAKCSPWCSTTSIVEPAQFSMRTGLPSWKRSGMLSEEYRMSPTFIVASAMSDGLRWMPDFEAIDTAARRFYPRPISTSAGLGVY